jgi:hypothetical protein
LSRLDSIEVVVQERLLAILIKKVGVQAVDLVKKHIRNWARIVSWEMDRTYHSFYAITVQDIIGIAVKNEHPDTRVYNVL